LLPVLAIAACVLIVLLCWNTMRTRSGMAPRSSVRQTLGVPALARSAAQLRPSMSSTREENPDG
jgi:hypothetical protein